MRRRFLAAALAGAVTLVTACGTTERGVATAPATSSGTSSASSSPSTGSTAEPTDSDTANATADPTSGPANDPGAGFDYPSTPATLPPTVSSEASGRLVEGARLSEYVVVPTLVLSDYTESQSFATYIFKDGESTGNVLPAGAESVAAEYDMISGFSTARSTRNDSVGRNRSLTNAVMIFRSPEDAAAAAGEMNKAIGAIKDAKDTMVVPGVDGAPVAAVVAGLNAGQASLFVARGSLVIYVQTSTKGDAVEAMTQVLATLLKAQFALSDKFVPTPEDQLQRLPVDREGMLAHTLLSTDNHVNINKVYGINGFKHYFANPLDDEPSIRAAGVDLVAAGLTTVYRAKDQAGAQLVADTYWDQYPGIMGESQEYQSKSGVEGARCLQNVESVRCVWVAGRYLVEASSFADNPEPDIDAIVSAQNSMLADF